MEKIKILVLDVDGTLTNGKIYIGNDGEIFKAFDVKDGYAIHNELIPFGITPVIITGRKSKIVENRCAELEIEYLYQGVTNKLEVMKEVTKQLKASFNEVAYIGDDLNDLDSMSFIKKHGGLIGCPNDACEEVKKISDFISFKKGGDGAVREFIEKVLLQDKGEYSRFDPKRRLRRLVPGKDHT